MRNKYIAIPQLLIGLFLYIIHLLIYKFIFSYNFLLIRWYAGDVLALFVCIPLFVNAQIFFNVRKIKKITIVDVILYFSIFSILFELVLPVFLKRLTRDYIDIAAYAMGGLLLLLTQNIGDFIKNRKAL